MRSTALIFLLPFLKSGETLRVPHPTRLTIGQGHHVAPESWLSLSTSARRQPQSVPTTPPRRGGVPAVSMNFWDVFQGTSSQKTIDKTPASQKSPIVICPAQLSVPSDYRKMIAELNKR